MHGAKETVPAGGETAGRAGLVVPWLALPVVAGMALWGALAPDAMTGSAMQATGWVLQQAGWTVLLLATGCLMLCGWMALGPWRHLRLGAADARPEFGTPSWIAMLFAAGMGTGLVVWGAAEPAVHMLSPPAGQWPTPADPARQAMVWTHLHWGLHAWSIYALCGLVVAWFVYRRQRPALVSAPLVGLLPGRAGRVLETGADVLGILAVTFGIAGTLVMGLLTVRSGLAVLGLTEPWLAPTVLAAAGLVALVSAATGIGAGIRRLSDFNIALALLLMLAVLVLGPTADLLGLFARSVGDYLLALPMLSLAVRPPPGGAAWQADWTLSYLLWWLAWGPFVGLFIARISKGRTVGAFVAGVVLVPTLGSMLWFAVLGGSVLVQLEAGGAGAAALATATRADPTMLTYLLLEGLPGGWLLAAAAVLLLLVFLVTSIDSGAWVLGMMSSGGEADPPVWLRLAWGLGVLGLAGGVLAVATLEVGRAMAILGALLFPAILAAQAVALVRDMRRDGRTRRQTATQPQQKG